MASNISCRSYSYSFGVPITVGKSSPMLRIECLNDVLLVEKHIERLQLDDEKRVQRRKRVKRRGFVVYQKPESKKKNREMYCPPRSSGVGAFAFMNFMMGTISIAASLMNNINSNNNNNNNNDNNNNNNAANINIGNNNNNGNNVNMVSFSPEMGRKRKRKRSSSRKPRGQDSSSFEMNNTIEDCEQHMAGKTILSKMAVNGIELYLNLAEMRGQGHRCNYVQYFRARAEKKMKTLFEVTLFNYIVRGAIRSVGLSC